MNRDNSRDPELGAEVALGWDSEALVEPLVLVPNSGINDLTMAIGLAWSDLPFVKPDQEKQAGRTFAVWVGSFVAVLL